MGVLYYLFLKKILVWFVILFLLGVIRDEVVSCLLSLNLGLIVLFLVVVCIWIFLIRMEWLVMMKENWCLCFLVKVLVYDWLLVGWVIMKVVLELIYFKLRKCLNLSVFFLVFFLMSFLEVMVFSFFRWVLSFFVEVFRLVEKGFWILCIRFVKVML